MSAGTKRKVGDLVLELETKLQELKAENARLRTQNKLLQEKLQGSENHKVNGKLSVSLPLIPRFLKKGDFYRSLVYCEEDEDDENAVGNTVNTAMIPPEIMVPEDCFKPETDIENAEDLQQLLRSLRYWLVSRLPDSVIGYSLNGDTKSTFRAVATEFTNEMPALQHLCKLAEYDLGSSSMFCEAIKLDVELEIENYLLGYCGNVDYATFDSVLFDAAEHGKLAYLKYAHEHIPDEALSTYTIRKISQTAAEGGHLECLKYLHENEYPLTENTSFAAASKGHLDCLKYLHINGCPWTTYTCRLAAEHRQVECLRYLCEHDCPWNDGACIDAAIGGSVDCLKLARSRGYDLDAQIYDFAALNGHVEMLKYLDEQGCPRGQSACVKAAVRGHFAVVKYAFEQGCPLEYVDSKGKRHLAANAAARQSLECLQYVYEHGGRWDKSTYTEVINTSKLDCLEYLHKHGCPWGEATFENAVRHGNLELVKYLHENGCPQPENVCNTATERGSLECLKYLHELGCSWDESTCAAAAESCSYECLKYLHENGCPWDETTCANCSGDPKDQYDCRMLEYAHTNGCPWDSTTCDFAAIMGCMDNLIYAHEHGCPWDEDTFALLVETKSTDTWDVEYLHDQGCPWDKRTSEAA